MEGVSVMPSIEELKEFLDSDDDEENDNENDKSETVVTHDNECNSTLQRPRLWSR